MSSEPRVVELSSSDEAEYEQNSSKRRRDDDDDVVIIEKLQRISTRIRERKEHRFMDSDDCYILENVPKVKLLETVENDVEELVVIGEVGPVACRDFPHARHLCAQFSFQETPHKDCCEQCHCYVCDKLAPCEYWETHCHASDKEGHWKTMRQSNKSPQLPPSATPPFPRIFTLPPRSGAVSPVARTNLPRSSSSVTMSDIARGIATLQPTPPRLTGPRTPKVHKNRTSPNAPPRYATAGTPRPPPPATSPSVGGSTIAPSPPVDGLTQSLPARPSLARSGLTRQSVLLDRISSTPTGPAAGVRPPVTPCAGLTRTRLPRPPPLPPQTPPVGHLRRGTHETESQQQQLVKKHGKLSARRGTAPK